MLSTEIYTQFKFKLPQSVFFLNGNCLYDNKVQNDDDEAEVLVKVCSKVIEEFNSSQAMTNISVLTTESAITDLIYEICGQYETQTQELSFTDLVCQNQSSLYISVDKVKNRAIITLEVILEVIENCNPNQRSKVVLGYVNAKRQMTL